MQKNTNMATRSKTKNEKKNNSSMQTEDEVEYKVNTAEKPLEHRRVITRQTKLNHSALTHQNTQQAASAFSKTRLASLRKFLSAETYI